MFFSLIFIYMQATAPDLKKELDDLQTVYTAVVHQDGSVDYQRLIKSPALLASLERYAAKMAILDPANLDPAHKLALLGNAYNVFTLLGVVKAWPIKSVGDVLPEFGFFSRAAGSLGGTQISLNDLEKNYLRPLDARVHFIVNCASQSCPKLDSQVLRPATVEAALARQARLFLADASKNRFEARNQWKLSKIFEWYADDFGGETGVIAFVRKYRPRTAAPTKISYLEYDWSLNGKSGAH